MAAFGEETVEFKGMACHHFDDTCRDCETTKQLRCFGSIRHKILCSMELR
jgi:hypothetical protein